MKNASKELHGKSQPEMKFADVINILQLLEANLIESWVDGGWCVDALLCRQTRPHSDLDIVIQQKDAQKTRDLLAARGFKDVERADTQPWNFVLSDALGHQVDLHVIVFDAERNGLYGPVEKGVMYPAGSLAGTGFIDLHPVKCISPEYLVKFHTGYQLREVDFKDVSALCTRFDIDYPKEYRGFL